MLGVRAFTINADSQSESLGKSSEPTEENIWPLIALVRQTGTDFGVTHDADSDRTIFITGRGDYVIGNVNLALIARAELSRRKRKVITPVNSFALVEDVVESSGGLLRYTAVGPHAL